MILRQAKEVISSNTLTSFSSPRWKAAALLGGCRVLRMKTSLSSTFWRKGIELYKTAIQNAAKEIQLFLNSSWG